MPQLVTAWQGIARAESQKGYEAALTKYTARFQYQDITEEHALYTAHRSALEAALQEYSVSLHTKQYCNPLSRYDYQVILAVLLVHN